MSAAASVTAQTADAPLGAAYQLLSPAQLDQLLGPIALYPDPLIAQILPASTLPAQIVLADRYVSEGGDAYRIDQQPWDVSVQALARYPSVLKWMDENLNWTTQLGEAFLAQQPDVMISIQRLRSLALAMGNLRSTPQQQVITDGGSIEIVPVDQQVIYLPVYQPTEVYYQPAGISFSVGFAIGGWLNCDFDWGRHNLIRWDHEHPRPPNWWHEPPRRRNMEHATVWHAPNRDGRSTPRQGDRGWGSNPVTRPSSPGMPGRQTAPAHEPRAGVAPKAEPAQPQQHAPAAAPRPTTGGAFTGIQSPHDTKAFSNRGQQSIQTIPRSAPPAHSAAPPARSTAPPASGGNSNPEKKR